MEQGRREPFQSNLGKTLKLSLRAQSKEEVIDERIVRPGTTEKYMEGKVDNFSKQVSMKNSKETEHEVNNMSIRKKPMTTSHKLV